MDKTYSYSTENMERTLGDGMDNSLLKLSEITSQTHKIDITSPNHPITFKPIQPQSEIFNLIPKYIPKERKQPKYLMRKPKEPKFVPYEPYKGAVEPIIPHKKAPIKTNEKSSKNNIDIHDLATQLSEFRTTELNKDIKEVDISGEKQWEKEKLGYEADIKNLRETNSHLENQLKFQAQVNSELKTLLVAAVGEDLESRVQHLTEDKLQLARALLNSANHLTSHQEQTEWLSGQCEVWRSKFLASSLMVEELARWKSALSSRITDLQETVKTLLDDEYKTHKKVLKTHCNLNAILTKLSPDFENHSRENHDLIELAKANTKMSDQIVDILEIDKDELHVLFEVYSKMPRYTSGELKACKLLQNPVKISNNQDAICNALVGAVTGLTGQQFLQHPNVSCCSHCVGQIEDV